MCVCLCEHAEGVLEMYKCINFSIHLKHYPAMYSVIYQRQKPNQTNKQTKNLDFNINKEANKSLGAAMQGLYRPRGLATGLPPQSQ